MGCLMKTRVKLSKLLRGQARKRTLSKWTMLCPKLAVEVKYFLKSEWLIRIRITSTDKKSQNSIDQAIRQGIRPSFSCKILDKPPYFC